ncbi:MAG: ectoine hydroxylase-related dioxygenase (phytanoyl-CoA dioxygenase family) [Gammaproteobacteria bacterium]|jgi:ectoine hydroxylase-related dioxygenase (phytanoyl-CoA dioxygenase family)
MNPDQILNQPAIVLEQSQRQTYFEQGYLVMPELIEGIDLAAIRNAVKRVLEMSRNVTQSNQQFDLEKGHSSECPKLRRVAFVDDLDESLWSLCKDSVITDIAVDILGPAVRFRDLFINFKWAGGGAEVKWHQDIAFYPHTNVNTCQFLLALEDVDSDQGPLQVIPRSHRGPIQLHYDSADEWVGAISEIDLERAGIDTAVELTGKAGTLSVHHSCTIHGSAQNMSQRGRPMLVITYSAADAIPYTAAPYPSSHYAGLVRGSQPRYAHHQELQMPLPPDWSDGYTSIFNHQEKAENVS